SNGIAIPARIWIIRHFPSVHPNAPPEVAPFKQRHDLIARIDDLQWPVVDERAHQAGRIRITDWIVTEGRHDSSRALARLVRIHFRFASRGQRWTLPKPLSDRVAVPAPAASS